MKKQVIKQKKKKLLRFDAAFWCLFIIMIILSFLILNYENDMPFIGFAYAIFMLVGYWLIEAWVIKK